MTNSINIFLADKNKINQINILIILLFPLALILGPFVAEILMNLSIALFIHDIYKNKKFFIFKNKIFLFFFIFYIYLILNTLVSEITDQVFLNIIFYIRFIIFSFAIAEVLSFRKNNLLLFYQAIFLTLFIISLDGYVQYIFGKNLIGSIPYRVDRISGFFGEDLILGSYLLRFIPLLAALILFFRINNKKNKIYPAILGSLIFSMIFLTGERAAFILSFLFLFLMVISLEIKIKTKILFLISVPIIFGFFIKSNDTLYDRYVNQLLRHTFPILEKISNTNPEFNKTNTLNKKLFPEHSPMFLTSYNMFLEKKFFGFGPKSYRYYCADERFVVYKGEHFIDNSKIKLNTRKHTKNFELSKFFVKEGDEVKKNDLLLIYNFVDEKKQHKFYSNKTGIIQKIYKKNYYINNFDIIDINPINLPLFEKVKINSCTTHPHNIYFQLLAETGIIGFLFITFLFFTLIFRLFTSLFFNKKLPIYEKSLIIGFIIILFPLSTSGNFFNNWLNMISFYPLGFYLYLEKKQNDKSI